MLADTEEKIVSGAGSAILSGGQCSFIAASYLPVNKRPAGTQIIGWLGSIDTEVWAELDDFAPTSRQRHQVLRAALEALAIRYAGALNPDRLRLRFKDLLEDDPFALRVQGLLDTGAQFQLSVEEADSLDSGREANSDLSLVYLACNSHCGWRFPEGAWSNASIERFHQQFWKLLREMLRSPHQPVGELEYLPDAEFELVTKHLSGTANYQFEDQSTASRFERIAKQFADRIAVVCGNRKIDYWELNEAANRLAHYLMYFSVRPSSVVAICLPPSIELAISKLAIQKLGAVSLVLDSRADSTRQAEILQNCGSPLCISNGAYSGAHVLNLETDAAAIRSQSKLNPCVQIRAEHAAEIAIAFDSGSTPQTTLYLHRSVLHTACGNEFFRTGCEDVIVQTAKGDSAQASFEFWSALLNGAKLILPMVEFGHDISGLAAFVKRNKASQLFIPEGQLTEWLRHGLDSLVAPETLIIGGPDEQRAALAQLVRHRRKGRLIHTYGNAGVGLFALIRQVATSQSESALAQVGDTHATYVLDAAGSPVAIGAVGELCIEGPGLAWGYMSDSGMERDCFASKDFGRGEAGRYYRSGDLVRWNESGRLERIARLGQLTQFEDITLDLHAIERELLKAPQVIGCAVVVREVAGHLQRLVAYVQLHEPIVNLRRVLREELAKSLPVHMLPSEFVPVNALPVNPDGQLDRDALSVPSLGPEVSDAEADARAAETGKLRRAGPASSKLGLWGLWKQALRKIV